MKRIAVYPGSFNPMHKGHLAVIRRLLKDGGFDKVYLVVSPHNPFKDASIADNGKQRLQDARLAIQRCGLTDSVAIEDIEFSMPQPSYTVDTLDALKAREPGNDFTLVIGADNLPDMTRWKEGARVLKEYGVVVYPREGYDMGMDCKVLKGKDAAFRIRLLEDADLVNISSTQIRENKKMSEWKI